MNRVNATVLAAAVLLAGGLAVWQGSRPDDASLDTLTRKEVSCMQFGPACDGGGYCFNDISVAVDTSDGGQTVLMDEVNAAAIPDPSTWCSNGLKATTRPRGTQTPAAFPCACAPRDGGCLLTDGGLAPLGVTLQPDEFTTGCTPRGCVEVLGIPGTPPECL